jgi:hypothetical protein
VQPIAGGAAPETEQGGLVGGVPAAARARRGRRGLVPGEHAGGDAQDGALSAAGRPCFGSRTGEMADDGPPHPGGRQPAAVVEDRSADPGHGHDAVRRARRSRAHGEAGRCTPAPASTPAAPPLLWWVGGEWWLVVLP